MMGEGERRSFGGKLGIQGLYMESPKILGF
jgi:hypothetical protein